MNNMPELKIGVVAVSRDCFPESLSVSRREALMKSCGNQEEYKKAKNKVTEWSNKLDKFTKANGVRRDFSREREMHQ